MPQIAMASSSTPPPPRIAVITAIGGGKDQLQPPKIRFSGVDYIAFTDDPGLRVDTWELRPLPLWSTDPVYARRRHARIVKILQTMLVPGYDFYIWHDGTHEVMMDPAEIVRLFLPTENDHFASYRHRERQCVYQEAKAIIKVKLDDADNVRRQIRAYRTAGFPRGFGLWETPFLIRRNSDVTRRLELAWWDHLARYSSRDQLSLPFVQWSLGLHISEISGGTAFENDFVRRVRRHNFKDFKPPVIARSRHFIRRAARRLKALLAGSRHPGPDVTSSP